MMKTEKLINYLDYKFSLTLAEKWDNSGQQTPLYNEEISNIHYCLDVNSFEIEQAQKKHANFILSHHPLYINEKQKNNVYYKKIAALLAEYKIDVYAAHTNLDAQHDGLNTFIVNKLGWKVISNIENNIGVICHVNDTTLPDIVAKIRQLFNVEVKCLQHNSKVIKTVAFCSGSGDDFYDICYKKGADVLITGDIGYHIKQEACDIGFNLIEVDHSIEKVVVELFEQKLKNVKQILH